MILWLALLSIDIEMLEQQLSNAPVSKVKEGLYLIELPKTVPLGL